MKENNVYDNERFDSYLNKIIIFSSKKYFKKHINICDKEKTIVDDDADASLTQKILVSNNTFDEVEDTLELNKALKSLSAIEQSVIFLLFKEELNQDEAGKILEICSKSVSRIKIRAINKLKKYLKGDLEDEK